jgi:hypothetical protein
MSSASFVKARSSKAPTSKAPSARTAALRAATTAALAVALGLTAAACAPSPAAAPAPVSQERTAAPAVALAASVDPAVKPAVNPAAPVDAAKPKPVKTFTFPDGHLSFQYPAGWSVRTADCPTVPGGPVECVEATISSKGKPIAVMVSGFYGDGGVGPVVRTVFDEALVPGLAVSGDEPTFAFFKDSYGDVNDQYFMNISRASDIVSGDTGSFSGQVLLPNGVGVFRVYIDSGMMSTDAEALAWMGTAEYAQLKSMLMSVSYK